LAKLAFSVKLFFFMKIYNTLTKQLEELKSIEPHKIGIYGCGLTPYDYSHLGHAMQGIVFDVIRKYLEFKGYSVIYVRNYTDIDDKIIKAAQDKGIDPLVFSKEMIADAEEDFKQLGVSPANRMPKVSESIGDIIRLINMLIDKGFAYHTQDGNVYFIVDKFSDYGKLSHQKIGNLFEGTRKGVEPDKKDPKDFALWKSYKPGEPFWDSPWGKGRPGWHIECSAMSEKYLGESFDIHGGGKDLIFPHHENEIAQSECAHGKPFATYWMHNGMMNLNGEKMSKSTKNYILIKDALKLYHSQTIRYTVLTNHYRSDQEYNEKRFKDAQKRIYYYYKTLANQDIKIPTEYTVGNPLVGKFEEYMDQDFNTVQVFALLDEQFRKLNDGVLSKSDAKNLSELIFVVGKVLGVMDKNPSEVVEHIRTTELAKRKLDLKWVEASIEKRAELRKSGKFMDADVLRDTLKKKGILISDQKGKSDWDPDIS